MADKQHWDIEITAERRILDIDFAALWRYRDLIAMFVRRDFVAFYKQTVLGPFWYVLQPLLMTSVFTIVFHRIANIPTDGTPPFLFYMTGLVAWQYFASCLTKTSDVFTSNAHIFGKVFFPRLAVPLAIVITNVISFAIQLALLACVLLFYWSRGATLQPGALLLVLPALLLQMAILALGVGALLSSLTTRYRDLNFLVGFGIQLWMYATPVVYPLSQVPAQWHWLMALNPMTSVVEIFRQAVLGAGTVAAGHVALSVATTLVLLLIGLIMFTRIERTSIDTV